MATVDQNKVRFFTGKNCVGESVEYERGRTIWFKSNDKWNDKFMSCIVGEKCKIAIWNSSEMEVNEKEQYQMIKPGSTCNDLSCIMGISKIQIWDSEWQYVVDCKFEDNIGNDRTSTGKWEIVFTPQSMSPVKLTSGSTQYWQIPMPRLTTGVEIVCPFIVRRVADESEIVCKGAVYWNWKVEAAGMVHCRKGEGYPSDYLDMKQDDNSAFTFTLLKQ